LSSGTASSTSPAAHGTAARNEQPAADAKSTSARTRLVLANSIAACSFAARPSSPSTPNLARNLG